MLIAQELRERIRMIERVLPKKAVEVEKQQDSGGDKRTRRTRVHKIYSKTSFA
jgi:hypothetical protein